MGCRISGSKYRWKKGRVPYVISNLDFPKGSAERLAIGKPIKEWNSKIVITLSKRGTEKDYVRFVAATEKYSYPFEN